MVKRGSNLKFICSFIKANPGARFKDIREALCRNNGIDPKAKPGQYTTYFSYRITDGRNYGHLWTKQDGKYYLTAQGYEMAA